MTNKQWLDSLGFHGPQEAIMLWYHFVLKLQNKDDNVLGVIYEFYIWLDKDFNVTEWSKAAKYKLYK